MLWQGPFSEATLTKSHRGDVPDSVEFQRLWGPESGYLLPVLRVVRLLTQLDAKRPFIPRDSPETGGEEFAHACPAASGS